jgi:peptidoglycan/LPS O-acetylase OafA/YrhL
MKARTFLVFYFSFLILALAGIGLYQNNSLPRFMEYLHICFMIFIVAIGLYQGYLMLRARKLEQPADDELSLKVLHRAAMISYLVSLNVWAILIYVGSKTEVDPFILFGTGILSMTVIFAVSWLIMKTRRNA